jgi:hypothetical protein
MNKNTVLRELAQKKYNVIESHIVRVDDTFTITSNDGEVYTEQDFTAKEIADIEAELLAKVVEAQAEAAAKKATAETKLAALGLTSEDLKALGLGGN